MGEKKKQKRARKSAQRNRYYRSARLSEHKFLRILQGYADRMTIQELDATIRVTARTIRETYGKLRSALPDAIEAMPDAFGGAGRVLAHPDAAQLLDAIRTSRCFRRYLRMHAPRAKPGEGLDILTVEFAVRVLCALDLRSVQIDEEEIIQALAEAVLTHKPRAPLSTLAAAIPGARPHGHPEARLFDDYRRLLLTQPLGGHNRLNVSRNAGFSRFLIAIDCPVITY